MFRWHYGALRLWKFYYILWLVRLFLAKIFLCLAVGILSSHQFIAHHHHEDLEVVSDCQYEQDHADGHHGDFPSHYIAHFFSLDKPGISIKALSRESYFISYFTESLQIPHVFKKKREYIEIRPPLIHCYKYFSLRGPPSLSWCRHASFCLCLAIILSSSLSLINVRSLSFTGSKFHYLCLIKLSRSP